MNAEPRPVGSEQRIRHLQRVQVAIVAAIALASVLASIVIVRSILTTGEELEAIERVEHTMLELKNDLERARSDYWRHRAEGGGAGIPTEMRTRFVERAATLAGLMEERRDQVSEREAIATLARASQELGRVVLADTSDIVVGSAADSAMVRAADTAIANVEAGVDGWLDVVGSTIAGQRASDDRLVTRLLFALGLLIALLVGLGVVLWALTERTRRASVAELAAERDATAAVMASVHDGVAVLGADGHIVDANSRLAELTGVASAHLLGGPAPWAADLPPGFVGETDVTITAADGSVRPVLLSASRIAAGDGSSGTLHILKDMTERVRAEHDLRDRATEQEVLRRVATLVAAGAEPSEVFDLVAQEVAGLLGVEVGVVTRFDAIAGRGIDVGVWVAPNSVAAKPPTRVPLDGDAPVARAFRTGRPARVDDLASLDRPTADAYASGAFRAGVAAPVTVGATTWGAVGALTIHPGQIPEGAEDRIGRLAELVGLTVANADARARLTSQAATDPLTGLANHRAFQERLEREVAEARDRSGELSLVVFDLDRFKEVNDAFGHQVGDEVLAEAARRLAGEARFGELVARVGGEEFAWILPGSDGINAYRAAERARRAVAAAPFAGDVGFVTASAGVADLTQADDAATLVRLADGALYWAKANGRNFTLRYSPEVVQELSATERAERLARSQGVTALRALARAVDVKDPSTARHAERVATVAVRLAAELDWTADRLVLLEEAALLHDVGKIGVPDALLFRSGRLSQADMAVVRTHATLGAEIVSDVLTTEQVSWVRGHHERWDGSGYPDGLEGDAIPDGARIIAVADAWDAMTSVRVYGTPKEPGAAVAEIQAWSGKQFAPAAADALRVLWASGRLTVTEAASVPRTTSGGGA